MPKNPALGRGLEALMGDAALRETGEGSVMLRIAQVQPRAGQPRQIFDEQALAELSDSIRTHGVLQPLAVRRLPTGYYQIIAGERRWRAARMAGLSEVPALVLDADDRRATELALVENLQREDLNPVEEAEGLRTLMQEYGLTQEECAARVGKSRPAVANAVRLLALPTDVLDMLQDGALTVGHARALLGLPHAGDMSALAGRLVREGSSVRQTEALVKELAAGTREKGEPARKEPRYVEEYERRLSSRLSRKVRVVAKGKRGRVELYFDDPMDLEALVALMEEKL